MRVTMNDLKATVNRLNLITDSPVEPYTKVDGKYKANVNNYHLDGAYGGWKLVRMMNESGGITTITSGYVSKRELLSLIHAYIAGIEAKQ